MSQLPLRRRILVGGVSGAAAVLAVGGVAYAVGEPGAPDPAYVQIVDSPSADPTPGESAPDESAPGGGAAEGREDCPEKSGGTGQGSGEEQPQARSDASGRT